VVRADLVGRESEMAMLGGWLQAAIDGHPGLVLCRGEPGIGKTRLAEEGAVLATAKGARAVWGRAVQAEGAPPYWPWLQLLRAIADEVDLRAVAGEHGLTADLGRLSPDLFPATSTAIAHLSSGGSVSTEDRFRQFDALGRLLRLVAEFRPMVIVLEDIHWADRPSLLLLQHVARTMTDERILIIANYRDTEPEHSSIVTDLLREPVTREVHLTGLAAPAVRRQLISLLGRDVSEAEAEEVHARSGGNPFFVSEVGRAVADRPLGAAASLVTASLRDAIDARLRRLSSVGVGLLQAASIVGQEFPVLLVASIVGCPVSAALGPLDQAVAAGLVEVGPAPATYRFLHALVRDAIEAGLGTAERVRLHRAAAEAIEKLYAGRLDDHLFDLARHWSVAAVQGDEGFAARRIQQAGEEAMRRLAFEEAARLFQSALDAGGPGLGDVDRCRLYIAVGAARHAAANVTGGLDACLRAAAVARRLSRPDLMAEAALVLGVVFSDTESNVAVKRLCEESLRMPGLSDDGLRSRVSARLAEACVYLSEPEIAGVHSAEALRLAEQLGDSDALVAALQSRRLVCGGPDGLDEREHLADRMLVLAKQCRSPSLEMWATLWRIDAAFERGDLLKAARLLGVLGPVVREVGGPWARWHLLRRQSVLAQAQAHLGDARRLAREAYKAVASTRHRIRILPLRAALLTVGHHGGQDEESLAVHGLDTTIEVANFPTEGVVPVLAAALLLTEVQRLPEANVLYRSVGPVSGWRPHDDAFLFACAFGIGVAMALSMSEDVETLHDRLAPYRGRHVAGGAGAGAMGYFGPVELWLGVAAGHLGLLDDAVSDLEQSVRACAINGADGFHAEARYELAVVLSRRQGRGDLGRARSLLGEVARAAAELGMVPLGSKTAGLIRRLDAAGMPSPLTHREQEVAELVARGLTNREIGDGLHLSERTAQNHVQHILTKLDLANRSQIAAWMTVRKMSSAAE
jgi:DNA-binding CsgD family transcriptional regulator